MRRRPSGSAAEDEGDDPASMADVISVLDGAGGRDSPSRKDFRHLQSSTRPSHPPDTPYELDRRKSTDRRPSSARSRRSSNTTWKPADSRNVQIDKIAPAESVVISVPSKEALAVDNMPASRHHVRRARLHSPWSCSLLTFVTTVLGLLCLVTIIHSFTTRQLDTKGCRMSYMRPSFAKLSDFDTEHTRFASKYSVYLYREGMVDEDTKVRR